MMAMHRPNTSASKELNGPMPTRTARTNTAARAATTPPTRPSTVLLGEMSISGVRPIDRPMKKPPTSWATVATTASRRMLTPLRRGS